MNHLPEPSCVDQLWCGGQKLVAGDQDPTLMPGTGCKTDHVVEKNGDRLLIIFRVGFRQLKI